jgi:ABC-type transport system involved in multi-copper enzyme maturation permease subunit
MSTAVLHRAASGDGVPFARVLHVELRKQVDTRAGRWLLVAIGAVTAVVLAISLLTEGDDRSFEFFLKGTIAPQAALLPVLGILAVTSEWSQRTGLVTFTLEPRRSRVAWAKLGSALLLGAAALVLGVLLAAVAHQASVTFRGTESAWGIDGLTALGTALVLLLSVAQGVGFGMLLRNTPAAIVVYTALPTAWAVLGGLLEQVRTAARWLDLGQTTRPLFHGPVTAEQWSQLGVSVLVWVALPLAVGLWRLSRADVR